MKRVFLPSLWNLSLRTANSISIVHIDGCWFNKEYRMQVGVYDAGTCFYLIGQ
jgi:hypothetical protein